MIKTVIHSDSGLRYCQGRLLFHSGNDGVDICDEGFGGKKGEKEQDE